MIGRTLPPAAAVIRWRDILTGVWASVRSQQAVEQLELQIQRHFDSPHCFLVSSGTAALTLILEALKDLKPDRDEVLIPAYTCYSVPSAIVRAGLKVRLCDIDPETFDFNLDELKTKVGRSSNILCVVPTHMFGFQSNISSVKELARAHDFFVVEDAAQSMGTECNGTKVGTLGDAGFFSLGRGKAFSTVEGGIVLTASDAIASKLQGRVDTLQGYTVVGQCRLLFYSLALILLQHPWLFWLPRALPFLKLGETHFDCNFPIRRFSGFQAGLAMGWESKLDALKSMRKAYISSWRKLLPDSIATPVSGDLLPLLRFPVQTGGVENRDKACQQGERLGIAPTYPTAINGIPALSGIFQGETFPAAEAMADGLITLPIHAYVNKGDQTRVVELLVHLLGKGKEQ